MNAIVKTFSRCSRSRPCCDYDITTDTNVSTGDRDTVNSRLKIIVCVPSTTNPIDIIIMPVVSVGMPLGPGCSTCGYCGPLGERSNAETSFKKAGFIASQLSCEVSPLRNETHVILFAFSDSSLGLSKDDLPRVETIWDILLCS